MSAKTTSSKQAELAGAGAEHNRIATATSLASAILSFAVPPEREQPEFAENGVWVGPTALFASGPQGWILLGTYEPTDIFEATLRSQVRVAAFEAGVYQSFVGWDRIPRCRRGSGEIETMVARDLITADIEGDRSVGLPGAYVVLGRLLAACALTRRLTVSYVVGEGLVVRFEHSYEQPELYDEWTTSYLVRAVIR